MEADREAGLRPPGSTRRQPGRGQSRGPPLPSSVFFFLGPLDDRDRVRRTRGFAGRLDRRRASARAIGRVERAAQARPAGELVVGGVGLVLGLGAAALATFAVRPLPYVGRYLLLPLALVLGVSLRRRRRAQPRFDPAPRRARAPTRPARRVARAAARGCAASANGQGARLQPLGMLVDTSAIIDGRIGDLISTGFVEIRSPMRPSMMAEVSTSMPSGCVWRCGRSRSREPRAAALAHLVARLVGAEARRAAGSSRGCARRRRRTDSPARAPAAAADSGRRIGSGRTAKVASAAAPSPSTSPTPPTTNSPAGRACAARSTLPIARTRGPPTIEPTSNPAESA